MGNCFKCLRHQTNNEQPLSSSQSKIEDGELKCIHVERELESSETENGNAEEINIRSRYSVSHQAQVAVDEDVLKADYRPSYNSRNTFTSDYEFNTDEGQLGGQRNCTVQDNRILVAAIDIGTTFSGYAFSFHHEYLSNKLLISTNMWHHSSGLSMKAPSAILISQNQEILAFGYEAHSKYLAMTGRSDNRQSYYFFEKFKMVLYDTKDINYESTIEDVNGNTMKAVDVIGLVILYLKNHLLKRLRGMDNQCPVDESMIHWVLTVPAIWNEKAKQFMRKASEKAGIPRNQLTLALEPEAASLFCKTDSQMSKRETPSNYLLVDLGGGTVDITAHEIHADGTIKELYQANGGCWGGTSVDKEFDSFLTTIFGADVMEKAHRQYPSELMDLQMEFENKKRQFDPSMNNSIVIKIPVYIVELYKTMKKVNIEHSVKESSLKNDIEFRRDKMFISPSQFHKFFSSSIKCIVTHIQKLLQIPDLLQVSTIILVGGYSEAPAVKEAIDSNFPDKRIMRPIDCSLAVLKGSVLYGHNPYAISSRICKYTYGIAITKHFKPGVHPENKKRIINDAILCEDIFDIHLRVGDKADIRGPNNEKSYRAERGQDNAILEVFASSERNPEFVTENTCFKLGYLIVDISDSSRDRTMIKVALHYKGTELAVSAREENTGNIMVTHLDFLG